MYVDGYVYSAVAIISVRQSLPVFNNIVVGFVCLRDTHCMQAASDWVAPVREKVALLSTSVRLTSNTQVGPGLKGNKVLAGSDIKRNEVVCLSALPFVAFLPVSLTNTFYQSR
ncbi:uncharacterized protein LY79DRAFT_564193 [Colletotrichum navitas]|uniref:Uncharacterized protein n=1 Tax=Colletotrichum navitas TaxID=681940 RepID=A0AAD8PRJ9_9PEZI|nr:uncharacterized protein LY79DRAFT_564193 [Colletotrichum navitas]KAK1579454.1 hypothetical protein LY79DRAFT_564193 [Colletotrichum navitas]